MMLLTVKTQEPTQREVSLKKKSNANNKPLLVTPSGSSPALSRAAHRLRGGFQFCRTQTDTASAGSPGVPVRR